MKRYSTVRKIGIIVFFMIVVLQQPTMAARCPKHITPAGYPTCTEPAMCGNCNLLVEEALGHYGGTATCTTKKVCSRCGESYGSTLGGHKGGTHANGGKCTVCGDVYQNHGRGTSITKTDSSNHYYKCKACSYEYSYAHSNGAHPEGKCGTCNVVYQTHGKSNIAESKDAGAHYLKCACPGCTTIYKDSHDGGAHPEGKCSICEYKYQDHSKGDLLSSTYSDANYHYYACTYCRTFDKAKCFFDSHSVSIIGRESTSNNHRIYCQDCNYKLGEHTAVWREAKLVGVSHLTIEELETISGNSVSVSVEINSRERCTVDKCNYTRDHPGGTAVTCTKASTCTGCGIVLKAALGHSSGSWEAENITKHIQKCRRCGNTIDRGDHNGATVENDGTCRTCGYKYKFIITASAGSNGSISPSGAALLDYGGSNSYTISPDSGYRIKELLIDGSAVSISSSYNFSSVTSNKTISVSFEVNECTVSFDSNGGSSVSSKTVTYGSSYGTLTTPSKTGYTFDGWYKESTFRNKVISSTTVTTAGDHTLYAKWEANTYTVSFNSNGGSNVSSKTVTYDSYYGTLTTPSKTGYTFDGWYKETTLRNEATSSSTVTTASNHTLYAKWEANTYTVSFDSNGGSNVSSKTVTYDSYYGSLSTPTRAGYTFDGWYKETTFRNEVTSTTTVTTTNNHTLYAKWTVNTYTVSFDSNGGSSVSSKTVTYDSTYGSLSTPTRTGYTFDGWYKETTLRNEVTSTTTVTTAGDHTLYAKWEANTYTVSFNSNGGSNVSSKTVTYDSYYGTLTTPSKTGYTFDGWYKETTFRS